MLPSCSEAIEEREVEEGDWRGLSKGEAETELAVEDSVAGLRLSATRLGIAVDDMLGIVEFDSVQLRSHGGYTPKISLSIEMKRRTSVSKRQKKKNKNQPVIRLAEVIRAVSCHLLTIF